MADKGELDRQLKMLPENYPNISFIRLFFSRENDCLHFPLLFDHASDKTAHIRYYGGLADFSEETLAQMRHVFDLLWNCDLEQFQPERKTYLTFLKERALHVLNEYSAEYTRLEANLFKQGNRIFAAEYFSRISELSKELSLVNGYLTMFSFNVTSFLKIEELENTILNLKQVADRVPELEETIQHLESILESEKTKNQALQNALAAQYGMKPSLTLAEKVTIINDVFKELGNLYVKDSFSSRTIQNWDNGKCPYNGYSSLYNAVELKSWANKIVAEIRIKQAIQNPIRGMSDDEMSRKKRS